MIPEQTSLPTIPELLKETLRLAREKRRETSRLLAKGILALSPILVVLFAYMVAKIMDDPIGPGMFGGFPFFLIAIPATIIYLFWLAFFFAKIQCDAMQIAFATVDNWVFWKQEERVWPFIRFQLLILVALMALTLFLKVFGLNIQTGSKLCGILALFFYLAVPAVIENGSALDALLTNIRLFETHARYIFTRSLVGWIPTSIPSLLLGAIALPKVIAGFLGLILVVFAFVYSIQYEPFFRVLTYRAVEPRSEDSPSLLPSEPLIQHGGTV